MSPVEKGFTPITEATAPHVRFAVKFPEYVNEDHIGVNLRAIERLCRMGGINHLRVSSTYNADVSSYTPAALGMNEQGQAFAGAIGTKHDVGEHHDTSSGENTDMFGVHAQSWISADINLNMREITATINDEGWKRGSRSPDAWSYHLNKALQEGIRHTGTNHLLFGLDARTIMRMLMYNSATIAFASDADPIQLVEHSPMHVHSPTVESFLASYATSLTMWYSFDLLTSFLQQKNMKDYRFSLFMGPQIDRALLLQIMSRTQTLAASLKQQ